MRVRMLPSTAMTNSVNHQPPQPVRNRLVLREHLDDGVDDQLADIQKADGLQCRRAGERRSPAPPPTGLSPRRSSARAAGCAAPTGAPARRWSWFSAGPFVSVLRLADRSAHRCCDDVLSPGKSADYIWRDAQNREAVCSGTHNAGKRPIAMMPCRGGANTIGRVVASALISLT